MRDHQCCNEDPAAGANVGSPKRILNTGPLDSDPALRLIDYSGGDGERVKYCAQSNCWGEGEEEHYTTTEETYQARGKGIKLEKLPRMFQDAVFGMV